MPTKTSPALIFVAWLIVAVPASWGIYNTVLNARKLFSAAPVTAPLNPKPSPAK